MDPTDIIKHAPELLKGGAALAGALKFTDVIKTFLSLAPPRMRLPSVFGMIFGSIGKYLDTTVRSCESVDLPASAVVMWSQRNLLSLFTTSQMAAEREPAAKPDAPVFR